MIHEEICTYEVCELAKEKGFDVPTHYAYNDNCRKAMYMELCLNRNTKDSRSISAPSQSLLQRWLREEKGLHISIPLHKGEYKYFWAIDSLNRKKKEDDIAYNLFDTYELALEDALKYALENLL